MAGSLGLGRWWRRAGNGGGGPSARQLLRWMDASPMGWVLLDPEERIQHISPLAERILCRERGRQEGSQRVAGNPITAICDDPGLLGSIALAQRQGRRQRLEWRYGGEDFDLAVVPGLDGWLAVQLQSRRSLEAQLEQQERWVSDVAHELKTPLTALLLVGDSLAAQVNDRNARLVERLQRELRRLQDLVVNLLELSRLENTLPGQGLRVDGVDLVQLVEQVWLGLRPLADQRGIALTLLAGEEGSGAGYAIRGDGARLHRAVLNLLDNALRFSPDGEAVEVALAGRGGWCQLSVRDAGPGLSEDDLTHMFERFYRGDSARARHEDAGSRGGGGGSGSGLGLAIVQQIAVSHGGRVQASNHPDGGALLELILPREPSTLTPRAGER
ncbi:two-component sensor histidine kinase, phosphate sensing [Cyanobium sp. PCC 7001]|uniref:sensor histidine kinase n=1 Tax=Cyanobium sp. PCC 7001 TaxID=180281 RepID=UPI0001805BEB|nr:HAMP domain-containing sensor histidine kinase [Cyanobium sp. PCC 7001]EDY38043.1 two-component sensor histidine kinase, phosphate sensing [Cyanobium sp. PCC 7001]